MSKTVVLTGCTRGLGRALVNRFAESGWSVVGCGRSSDSIDALRIRFPRPHRFDAVDVSDFAQVDRWADSVLQTHGAPQLLLNNAAVINRTVALWEVPVEEFSRLMRVNIDGTFHVLRRFVPAMAAAGEGIIVNFSSGWGRSTSPEVAPYCASKWAIEGLTQALAQELPPGLAAVALNPGIINTDMLRSCWAEEASQFPDPETWSRRAAPFLMRIRPDHNGRSLTVE